MNHYNMNPNRPGSMGGRSYARSGPVLRQPSGFISEPVTELGGLPLAMAYVPIQQWGEQYSPALALERGTLFPQLDLPFFKGGGR